MEKDAVQAGMKRVGWGYPLSRCVDKKFSRWTPAFFRLDRGAYEVMKMEQPYMLIKFADNNFDSDFKNEMKVRDSITKFAVPVAYQQLACQVRRPTQLKSLSSNYHSNGLADQLYCEKLEIEVPHTVQYLLDREQTHVFIIFVRHN